MAQTDWSEWSEPQIRVLCELDFGPPLHETHLRRRAKARSNTLRSLERAGLIRREWLSEPDAICAMPFFRLTQQGQAVKRDWLRWNASVSTKVAAIFAGGRA